MNETTKIYLAYREKFGNPPLPDVEWPLQKYGPMPPEADTDLTPLLARCLAENRPATEEECARAAYFRDGWFRCPRDAMKDGEPVEVKARTFAELRKAVDAADRNELFDAVNYD